MGSFSLLHWGVVLIVVLLLFGRRSLSGLMGEMGAAIGMFRKTVAEEKPPAHEPGGASGSPPSILV